MKVFWKRIICLFLMLSLLPLSCFGEGYDTEPLYRSTFRLGFSLDPKAFPKDGQLHYTDWQSFLSSLKLAGTIDYQRPEQPDDQYVRAKADILFDDESYFPFTYESYGYSRFFTAEKSPFTYIFFNMPNFWEFMVKPFIFMDLPTNLISMGMYWEQSRWVVNSFLESLRNATDGKTKLSYEEVTEAAEALSEQIMFDDFSRYYYFLYGFLGLIYGNSLIYDDLCYLTDWVDYLDPDQKGLTIRSEGTQKQYQLGDHLLLTVDGESWHFIAPDPNGYIFDMALERKEGALCFTVKATLEEDERLNACFSIDGLPGDDTLNNEGSISFSVSGSALRDSLETEQFECKLHYLHSRSSLILPRSETFQLEWIHPESELPALGMSYEAIIEEAPASEINNDFQSRISGDNDFFSLNDQKLITFKEFTVRSLLITLLPLALRIPIGVFSDVYAFVKDTGFLAMLGFEGAQ